MVKAQPIAFEGANVIVITTDLADKEAYLTISQVLMERNIPFEVTDDCLQLSIPLKSSQYAISTEPTLIGQISVHAGLVRLTGTIQGGAPARNTGGRASAKVMSVVYQKEKSKSTFARMGFLYLSEVAHKLRPSLHGVISYKVQPEPMD
ncbi:MAG: hypothetical protein EOO39_17950 [Cytophagaceae bacterium]|nr:MAG: hypothetical protein EOO39_17950 [Cytophagaceae bacterium]